MRAKKRETFLEGLLYFPSWGAQHRKIGVYGLAQWLWGYYAICLNFIILLYKV